MAIPSSAFYSDKAGKAASAKLYEQAPGASAFEKLQNAPFGSWSASMGQARPVGRSTMDPMRALGMLSRGTARPGQVQAALGMAQLQRQQAQDERQGLLFDQQMQQADALTEAYKRMGLLGGDGQPPVMPGVATPPSSVPLGGARPISSTNPFGNLAFPTSPVA